MKRRTLLVIAVVVGFIAAAPLPTSAQSRPVGDTRLFAWVPPPNHPGGIVVDGDVVYVNTFNPLFRPLDGYDAIFAYDRGTGELLTDRPNPIAVPRRVPATIMGLAGMALDADGRLYVADMTGRIVRVDPASGNRETYATFPTDTKTSVTAMPGDVVFAQDGTMYVTDTSAPIIWRVPPGGGMASPWLVDPLTPGVWAYGYAGIALDASQSMLYFAGHTGSSATVLRVPVDRPSAAAVEIVKIYPPAGLFGSADLAFGESGKLYVVLLGAGQISVLRTDGSEEARIPGPGQSGSAPVPWDDPLFLGFDGDGSVLVTNSGFSTPDNAAVLEVFVDDTALPASRPSSADGTTAAMTGTGLVRASDSARSALPVRAALGGPAGGPPVAVGAVDARVALSCSLRPPRAGASDSGPAKLSEAF